MMWKTEPATGLARSGQRMLWCHTPQVIHSGLLRKLRNRIFDYRSISHIVKYVKNEKNDHIKN